MQIKASVDSMQDKISYAVTFQLFKSIIILLIPLSNDII